MIEMVFEWRHVNSQVIVTAGFLPILEDPSASVRCTLVWKFECFHRILVNYVRRSLRRTLLFDDRYGKFSQCSQKFGS